MGQAIQTLNIGHVESSLSQDILLGSLRARDGKKKWFYFNPWKNEYKVVHDGKTVDSGQALEELLEVYNSI